MKINTGLGVASCSKKGKFAVKNKPTGEYTRFK